MEREYNYHPHIRLDLIRDVIATFKNWSTERFVPEEREESGKLGRIVT